MAMFDFLQRVSASPTHPNPAKPGSGRFDVASFYQGEAPAGTGAPALDEKLRQAYFWIVNSAIISPYYDVDYHTGASQNITLGDARRSLSLPGEQSYSSYVLLPLLTFALRGKCLFVGGPGRGKTASAVLMGVLAGSSVKDVRRAMQHGQPQMTVADLLGNPLPADLVTAQSMEAVRIAWRPWLAGRVKIVDEYNRIPTRTQSALLTLMGDNYAEVLGQIYEAPTAAWYLTANDDAGGGTYAVIEALRDRIDVTVPALPFNPHFLEDLLLRLEQGIKPEELLPPQLVFTAEEIDALSMAIHALPVPQAVRRRLEFFASQLELLEAASPQPEAMNKDTARLSGLAWDEVLAADPKGRDRARDLGAQTKNGLSVRSLTSLLRYAKALAWFRGGPEVALADLRHVLPFVLADKLVPDFDAPFFAVPENAAFKIDRRAWVRQLFDSACAEYDRLDLDREHPVTDLLAQLRQGLDGLSESDTRKRLSTIEKQINEIAKGKKLYGHLHNDVLALKYLHQRYSNYLAWLRATR